MCFRPVWLEFIQAKSTGQITACKGTAWQRPSCHVIYLPYLTSPRVRSCCYRAIIWPQLSATVSPRLEEVDEQTVHIWHKHLLNKVIQFSGKWHQHRILQPLHMPAPCQKRSPAEPQTLVTRDIIGCQRSPKWHSANWVSFLFFFPYNHLRRGFFLQAIWKDLGKSGRLSQKCLSPSGCWWYGTTSNVSSRSRSYRNRQC